MKITRTMEIGVGFFVSLGLAALLMLALKVANLTSFGNADGYLVLARFDNIGGLQERSAVKMGGVLVGRVTRIDYDSEAFRAVVEMRIDPRFREIPVDTAASIYTAGLLGEQYVNLDAGGDEEVLADGGELEITQSAVIMERMLQEFLYSKTVKDENP
ncbi:MAG: outer membrane lipid asymmetry maintenance protein MlaD [Gammaproteobacteria bacterium]|nr:outer membrane lipid asymmetry maintenance protein MlaD [Gammaproteobacteria bacterium]